MGQKVSDRLKTVFGDRIIEINDFRGDDAVRIAAKDWLEVARFLRDDPETAMDLFIDLTAVDYPGRQPPEPRFDVLLMARSLSKNLLVRIKTRVGEDQELDSLTPVWSGADWAEREAYDMFGIRFKGHPNLRRVLLYDQFDGHPLRKDYPITKTQPLVAYREAEDIGKIPPFGEEEGKVWSRINWSERSSGRGLQVSPSLALQRGERPALSQDTDKQPE